MFFSKTLTCNMLKSDARLILLYTCPAADVCVYMREIGTAHSAVTFSPL